MRAEDQAHEVSIQRVQVEDLPEVLTLAARCPEAPGWPADAWHSFVLPEQSEFAMRRVLFASRALDEAFGGLIAVTLMEGTTELELLLVEPRSRRRGLGSVMVRYWLDWARQAGALEAVLEVRASNAAAQILYRAFGFTDQGWRPRYYHRPSEDALLMRKAFDGSASLDQPS